MDTIIHCTLKIVQRQIHLHDGIVAFQVFRFLYNLFYADELAGLVPPKRKRRR